jgi:hypothetical protein
MLFSAGEDGSIFILETKSKESKPRKLTENVLYPDLDQVIVPRSEIEMKNSQLEKMKARYDEMAIQHEYQIKLKEMNHAEVIGSS